MNRIDDATPEVALLRAFDALLTERHVTRAALRLGMTQSATSHALGRLRRLFDDPLFVRGPRGVVPTERAEALGPEVRRVLEQLDQLTQARGPFDPAKLRRRFVLGGVDFAEMIFLPKLVPLLAAEAPGVDLVFRSVTILREEELERDGLDLVIGVFREAPSRLLITKLFEEQFVSLFRKGHPALRKPLTAARWSSLQHVMVSPRGEGGGIVDDMLAKRGLSRRIAARTATFLTAPLIVEASDCVTTLPRRVAQTMAVGRELVMRPPPIALPGFTVTLAFHERSRHDPAHIWLRKKLSAVLR
jgi:DNA-binding transcriptional LysR family regulator